MEHIYEVVDATDEERYYSLGLFMEEGHARTLLWGESPPYNDGDPDAVTVEIRKRRLGFHPHEFTVIAKRTWVRNYDAQGDESDWSAKPVEDPNTGYEPRDCGEKLKP